METAWLVDEGVVSKPYLDKLIYVDKKIKKVRRSAPNTPALVAYETIPPELRAKIEKITGPNPMEKILKEQKVRKIETDYEAHKFFAEYRYLDGSPIPTKRQDNILLWANSASILNTLKAELGEHTLARAAQGRKPSFTLFYKNAVEFIKDQAVREKYEHNLPTNARRLREKLEKYIGMGYESLIKHNKSNDNARKINYKLEQLICYIATMPTRPYNTRVKEIYDNFMQGEIEIVDAKTGEMFARDDYIKDGKPIQFSEGRAWQIVNNNENQIRINKKRMGWKDFDENHRPHRHRNSPVFAFNKVSLDDRDLIWKDKGTKKRVKAYYAYEVASGCRVGSAYSMTKDETLFLDCLRDMFVFIDRNNLGTPMEVEVENHLVNKFFRELEEMFPILTICAPANSKEKRAEHFNRAVKYSIEKNNHPGVGRWWLKSKYNRIAVDKVDDEFKEKMKTADRMIADDILDTIEYNNMPHPNRRLYPGMTRLEVLFAKINPDLPKFEKSHIYKYIGFEANAIKIYNSQYVKVQYEKYVLPHPAILKKLKPNNLTVDARYMPDNDGIINEVYLYQDGEFICSAKKLIAYNEAKAERTAADDAAKLEQDKYVAQFDKYSKDDTWAKIEIIKNEPGIANDPEPAIIHTPKLPGPDTFDDFDADDALNNF